MKRNECRKYLKHQKCNTYKQHLKYIFAGIRHLARFPWHLQFGIHASSVKHDIKPTDETNVCVAILCTWTMTMTQYLDLSLRGHGPHASYEPTGQCLFKTNGLKDKLWRLSCRCATQLLAADAVIYV